MSPKYPPMSSVLRPGGGDRWTQGCDQTRVLQLGGVDQRKVGATWDPAPQKRLKYSFRSFAEKFLDFLTNSHCTLTPPRHKLTKTGGGVSGAGRGKATATQPQSTLTVSRGCQGQGPFPMGGKETRATPLALARREGRRAPGDTWTDSPALTPT